MATAPAEQAVRTYLTALKDPSSLRDDDMIAKLERELEQTDDQVERVKLRQQLLDAQSPSVEQHEEAFVAHAKQWAQEQRVTAEAFEREGVPPAVLRKAGFSVRGTRGQSRSRSQDRSTKRRSRVSAEEVRKAIPRGTFTIKQVEEACGASPAVVRRVVQEVVDAGQVTALGPDPDHSGPGRAPVLYRKK